MRSVKITYMRAGRRVWWKFCLMTQNKANHKYFEQRYFVPDLFPINFFCNSLLFIFFCSHYFLFPYSFSPNFFHFSFFSLIFFSVSRILCILFVCSRFSGHFPLHRGKFGHLWMLKLFFFQDLQHKETVCNEYSWSSTSL